MTTTIQQAVRPLFIVCFIVGLGVHPLKKSKPKIKWIYLTILYSLTIWLIYCFFVHYMLITSSHSLISLFRTSFITISAIINMIIAIISTILNIYHDKVYIYVYFYLIVFYINIYTYLDLY